MALRCLAEPPVRHVGHGPTQYGVAEEFQALVAPRARMFSDPRTMVQRVTEELAVGEGVTDPFLQDGESFIVVGGRSAAVQAIARSCT